MRHPVPAPSYPGHLAIGNKVRACREKLKWTTKELAARLNMSHQNLNRIERGFNMIYVNFLYEVSIVMGVDINYFFEGENGSVKKGKGFNILFIGSETNPVGDEYSFRQLLHEIDETINLCFIPRPDNASKFTYFGGFPRYLRNTPLPHLIFLEMGGRPLKRLKILKELKTSEMFKSIPVVMIDQGWGGEDAQRKRINTAYFLQASGVMFNPLLSTNFDKKVKTVIKYWKDIVKLPK